jgi:hypothetical protein
MQEGILIYSREVTPMMERGTINIHYSVMCPCGESAYADYNCAPSTRREAAAQARLLGWVNSRLLGWLCPECQAQTKRDKAIRGEAP